MSAFISRWPRSFRTHTLAKVDAVDHHHRQVEGAERAHEPLRQLRLLSTTKRRDTALLDTERLQVDGGTSSKVPR